MTDTAAEDICRFWFDEVDKSNWFKQTDEFDAELREKFSALLERAKNGDLDHWCDCAEGYLGLIVVLDQFSRNIHRDSAEAFAADDKALELAKELMYYGVSAISLVTTGSHQEGLRACTSFIKDHQYAQLDERMKLFAENHPIA